MAETTKKSLCQGGIRCELLSDFLPLIRQKQLRLMIYRRRAGCELLSDFLPLIRQKQLSMEIRANASRL